MQTNTEKEIKEIPKEEEKKEESVTKPVKLTKSGKVDKRSETSRNNIKVCHQSVKQIITKAKVQKAKEVVEEEDTDTDESDTEVIITKRKRQPKVVEPKKEEEVKIEVKDVPKQKEKVEEKEAEPINQHIYENLIKDNELLRQELDKKHHISHLHHLSKKMLCKF